jgi:hypothetical protein
MSNFKLKFLIQTAFVILATSTVANAQSKVPASPDDGGPLLFEVKTSNLNLREQPSTSAKIVAKLKLGTLVNNLGCERQGVRVWCDVQPMGGGPRGYAAVTYLVPPVSPHGAVAYGPDTTALRAGQGQFDANGPIKCAIGAKTALGTCQMGVARHPGGWATVVVTHGSGKKRAIYFQNGTAIGGDTSEADYSGSFKAAKVGDMYRISIGNERYEFPEMFIFGG